MKLYLLLPIVTLTIGLAVPALAQQEKTAVDAQTVQQLHAIGSKSDEAFKKGDAAARAALFTEDAILLGPNGPIKGRQAIEKYYTDLFQKVHFIENVTKYDKDSPTLLAPLAMTYGKAENGVVLSKTRMASLNNLTATGVRLRSVKVILGGFA